MNTVDSKQHRVQHCLAFLYLTTYILLIAKKVGFSDEKLIYNLPPVTRWLVASIPACGEPRACGGPAHTD